MSNQRRPRVKRAAQALPLSPMATNPELAAAILAIVDTQLSKGEPPETRATFERLVATGFSPEGARQLLAHVVVVEIFDVMSRGEAYNRARFVAALEQLPQLPTNDGV